MLAGDFTTIATGRGVPFVLSGAVSKREGRPGPFFSGIGLGMSLQTPFVAISDPTLTVDPVLRLGWYAGRAGEDVQGHLACSRIFSAGSTAPCCSRAARVPASPACSSARGSTSPPQPWCGTRRPTCSTTTRVPSSTTSASRSGWSGQASLRCPGSDLRGEVDDIAGRTSIAATREADGSARATVVWEGRPSRYGGVTTRFEVVDRHGTVISSHLQRDNALVLLDADPRAVGVRAHLRDGFLHEIVTVPGGFTRTPQRVRVLVTGSQATRDTFAFLDPGLFRLDAFVARQSLISAFGPAGEPPFDPSVLLSAFQRRMVEGDACSRAP
ncbi:hypothetical protein ASG73_16405 [Janibacter sp. Soil728]|uniref:DUF6270 domain-containing protein n=1 Tax=Janibacter sp. Soil728 TaxID=1736393 RepID=UPI0006F41446|nr:DUF6270 domain-containing protein [Janibacter sp. Soil728]KRE35516.1 hypothetical protein ASG73_16405 [Janibacter sp. Soil728]